MKMCEVKEPQTPSPLRKSRGGEVGRGRERKKSNGETGTGAWTEP